MADANERAKIHAASSTDAVEGRSCRPSSRATDVDSTPGMPHASPEDPSEYVTPPLVRGEDPIRKEERHSPGMISKHPVTHALFGLGLVGLPVGGLLYELFGA